MKTEINKSAAAATETEPEAFELTNITVKEVSLVDRAANKKRFLVTKSKKKIDQIAAQLNPALGKDLPGADLDAAAVVEKTEAQLEIERKDAADAAEYAALKTAGGAPVSAPASAPASVAVDAAKAFADLEAATKTDVPAANTPAKKDDTAIQVVVVSPEVLPNPAAVKVKAAILAGIDKIAERCQIFRTAVEGDDSGNQNTSGVPWIVYEHSYYIQRMLDAVCSIGGPEWEIDNATEKSITEKAAVIKSKAIMMAQERTVEGSTYVLPIIGDRVRVLSGKAHDEQTATLDGTITEIDGTALGILFDGMTEVHHWYVASEVGLIDATDKAVTKKYGVVKSKAITMARVEKLRGIHKGMGYCASEMDKVMKELDDEKVVEPAVDDTGSAFAKSAAAPVVATAAPTTAGPGIVVPAAPNVADIVKSAVDAALSQVVKKSAAEISALEKTVKSLQSVVAEQGAQLEHATNDVHSNALTSENIPVATEKRDNVMWSDDLAPARGRTRSRF